MFYFDKINGKKILKSDMADSLCHFFTTRECPVRGNEEFFKTALKAKRIVSPVQTHSANVEIVSAKNEYTETDGLILPEPGTVIYLSFADCVPLIFYDKVNRIAAISHAGWRGTAERIGVITAGKMNKHFGTQPKDLIVVIGPAISACCYEVGEEVFAKLIGTVSDTTGLFSGNFVDLKKINARQLKEIGVYQIDIAPYCTRCNNDLFFSYRKECGTIMRHNAVVML